MLEELRLAGSRVAGVKQVLRALEAGKAAAVYVARDADPALQEKIFAACRKAQTQVCAAETMRALGNACSIEVPAACAAILRR